MLIIVKEIQKMKKFNDYSKAESYMKMKNQNKINKLYILIDGPDGNYFVMELKEYHDMEIEVSYQCKW